MRCCWAWRLRLQVMDTVRRHFRPELLNRLDDIVIFRPLDSRGLRSIVRLQMESLVKRLKERDMYVVCIKCNARLLLSSRSPLAFLPLSSHSPPACVLSCNASMMGCPVSPLQGVLSWPRFPYTCSRAFPRPPPLLLVPLPPSALSRLPAR